MTAILIFGAFLALCGGLWGAYRELPPRSLVGRGFDAIGNEMKALHMAETSSLNRLH